VKILFVLVNVAETVDLFAGQMRGGRHETLVFRHLGKVKGLSHDIETRREPLIVTPDLFTAEEQIPLHFAETLDILLFRSHFLSTSSVFFQTKISIGSLLPRYQ
jgi:hypothetical protein